MSDLANVFGAAKWVQGKLDDIDVEFCFIGGIALQRPGATPASSTGCASNAT
jgi:hypothetical protein